MRKSSLILNTFLSIVIGLFGIQLHAQTNTETNASSQT